MSSPDHATKPDTYLGDDGSSYGPPTEAYLRGHLTRAECERELVDPSVTHFVPTDEPTHTWGRRGLWTDEDGVQRTGGLHWSPTYAGQRGAFRVTVIGVRVENAAP